MATNAAPSSKDLLIEQTAQNDLILAQQAQILAENQQILSMLGGLVRGSVYTLPKPAGSSHLKIAS